MSVPVRGSLKPEDDRQKPSMSEKAIMVGSVVVTFVLIGYLVFQAATAPEPGPPGAEIVASAMQPDGSQIVEIRLTNPGGFGLRQATVEVDCGSPPPSITLENIPAESHRLAHLVCPPGTSPTQASVTNWYRA